MTKNEQIAALVSEFYKQAIQATKGETFDDIYNDGACVNWPDTLKWAVLVVESGHFDEVLANLKAGIID